MHIYQSIIALVGILGKSAFNQDLMNTCKVQETAKHCEEWPQKTGHTASPRKVYNAV